LATVKSSHLARIHGRQPPGEFAICDRASVGYRPKHFFQAAASAQQGGTAGDAAGGGLDAAAGTAAAPASSIDQVTIQGGTAAGGAGSPHQLATAPALVDQQ
jgi:hypothetical protein